MRHGVRAGADAHGFEAVGVTAGAIAKVVALDEVMSDFTFVVEPDDEGHARMLLTREQTMVDPMAVPGKTEPMIARVSVNGIVVHDAAIGDSIIGASDAHDVARLETSVFEGKAVQDDVFAV